MLKDLSAATCCCNNRHSHKTYRAVPPPQVIHKPPSSNTVLLQAGARLYVIVRPLSTVEYTSVASVFHSTQWSDYNRCSCTVFTLSSVSNRVCLFHAWKVAVEANSVVVLSGLFTLGWMCPLKREQARRERESEIRLVNSL